jgi:hypothetical protein
VSIFARTLLFVLQFATRMNRGIWCSNVKHQAFALEVRSEEWHNRTPYPVKKFMYRLIWEEVGAPSYGWPRPIHRKAIVESARWVNTWLEGFHIGTPPNVAAFREAAKAITKDLSQQAWSCSKVLLARGTRQE